MTATCFLHHSASGLWACPDRGLIFNEDGSEAGFGSKSSPYIRVVQPFGAKSCRTWYAHRVIWEVVNGTIPPAMQVDHINGDPTDNRLINLDLVTKAENQARLRSRYKSQHGAYAWNAKLSPELVALIRATADAISVGTWARRLGVESSTIRQAREGRTWTHVEEPPVPRPRPRPRRRRKAA